MHTLVVAFVLALSLLATNCNFPGSPSAISERQPVITSTTHHGNGEQETLTSSERKILIYAINENSNFAIAEAKSEVIDLAQQSGLNYEDISLLDDEEIQSNVSLVFIFEEDPGIEEFASRFPNVQFVVIGTSSVSLSDNVSVLREEELIKDQQSFVAGYIAAMIADDWRAGVVAVGDGEVSGAIETGFLNGAKYFCGLCRPAFPPFKEYPQSYSLDYGGNDWEMIVENLRENKISVIYLAPIREFEISVGQWMQIDSVVIGDGPRPISIPEEQWVATVQYSAAESLKSIWNELLAGKGGFEIKWNLFIVDINRELLSTGREREALGLIEELEAGFVGTGYESPDT